MVTVILRNIFGGMNDRVLKFWEWCGIIIEKQMIVLLVKNQL